MLGMEWHNSANDIVLIGAAAAVVLGAIRASFKAMRFFQRLDVTMAFVERELKPNGGGSTYDIVRRAALDAQRAANAAEEAHAHTEQLLERVSNLEQVVVAWTPKKAPAARGTRKPTATK